jgi:hypothetical protein
MKIRPVGAELFHSDGRTDMTKITVVFRNVANAPESCLQKKNFMKIGAVTVTPSSVR